MHEAWLPDAAAVRLVQGVAAVVFLGGMLRLALLLGATPVGAMRQEILYLRSDVFRPLVRLTVAILVLEAVEMLLPSLAGLGPVTEHWVGFGGGAANLAQAALLAVLAVGTLRAFRPYSRRSLAEIEVLARRGVESVARRVARRPAQHGQRRAP